MATAKEHIDGLKNLPVLDPVRAEITNRLIALLNGEWVEDGQHRMLLTEASVSNRKTNPWFETSAGLTIHIASANGARAVYAHDRLDDIVVALDAIDPLLTVVERCIGRSLEPLGLVDEVEGEAIYLSIALYVEKQERDRIDLAIPMTALNMDFLTTATPVGTPVLRDIPSVITHLVRASDLPIDEAAALTTGDMILMGARSQSRLEWSGGASDGVFDFESGAFSIGLISGEDMNDDAGRSDGNFSVPISIRLPSRALSLETVASLKPGATLPLEPITNGLGVDILVGGRVLAKGEIVQVGSQFAVLIEGRMDLNQEMSTSGEEE